MNKIKVGVNCVDKPCHNHCHYEPGWHCFIPCCMSCQQLYDESDYTIKALEDHLYDMRSMRPPERFVEKYEVSLRRLEGALERLKAT